MTPALTAAHERALACFSDGEPGEALAILRDALTEAIDPDALNDYAVMLAEAGKPDAARRILLAVQELAPSDDTTANLTALALGGPPPPATETGDAELAEARARLLDLIRSSRETYLADNVDYLFHPWGAELPDRAGTAERAAAQLDVLARSGVFWRNAGDEATRELFLRVLAYRTLGPAHVRLELEPGPYRRHVVGLTAQLAERTYLVENSTLPFEWQLHLYDLARIGFRIKVVGSPLPLASTFVFSQYAYRDESVAARPQPGDVAIDAGGCWGETALWLAHEVGPRGSVHTFEPTKRNREVLQSNIGLNPALAERIRVHADPLAAARGETVWMRDVMAAGAQVQTDPGDDSGELLELTTTTIDALVERGALERVDFIKVDVEGVDLDVLRGAAETIRTHRPRLAIAAYHRPDDLAAIPDFVDSLGVDYRWYLQCSTMTDIDMVALGVPSAV